MILCLGRNLLLLPAWGIPRHCCQEGRGGPWSHAPQKVRRRRRAAIRAERALRPQVLSCRPGF